MKNLDGDQQRDIHTEPFHVLKLTVADAIKRTNNDYKCKATDAAKLQHKKHDIVQTE